MTSALRFGFTGFAFCLLSLLATPAALGQQTAQVALPHLRSLPPGVVLGVGQRLATTALVRMPAAAVEQAVERTEGAAELSPSTLKALGIDPNKLDKTAVVSSAAMGTVGTTFFVLRAGATPEKVANLDPQLLEQFSAAFARNPKLSAVVFGATAAGFTVTGIEAIASEESALMHYKFVIAGVVGVLFGAVAWWLFRAR
jgi:hypothetical protein